MKKKYYGQKDTISVYQFMEMCGLKCEYKENVRVSQKIMMGKLIARKEKFKETIIVPRRACLDIISTEAINIGHVIMVRDDYGVVYPYIAPKKMNYEVLSNENMEEKRNKILSELQDQNNDLKDEKMTTGYIKYLVRIENRRRKEKLEELKKMLFESKIEEEITVTEHNNRNAKLYSKLPKGYIAK